MIYFFRLTRKREHISPHFTRLPTGAGVLHSLSYRRDERGGEKRKDVLLNLLYFLKAQLERRRPFWTRTNKWNPHMPLTSHRRNGIHIIDLQQTVKPATRPMHRSRHSSKGGTILFIGTKRQPKP